ncbi:MAG: hypothetical protein KatS3mg022_2165 [Armatimonadota bacterium]|nr:MAG: hypothetical protein KatS3mg022_2165 [Armatimonadota bacterium]
MVRFFLSRAFWRARLLPSWHRRLKSAATTVVCLLLFVASLAHADTRWHFRATIGVDDGVLGRPGAAIFRVFVGDEKVYESPVMKAGDNPITIHIPLRDTDTLTLEVADTGDGHGGDWGDWCDARIQDDSRQTTIWLSDLHEKVLEEWITTRKDRNIVGQPLKLQGRIYCRGLGTVSGSRMRYTDWYAQWQRRERRLQQAEQAAAQRLQSLRLEGNLRGARLLVNGRLITALPARIPSGATVQVGLTLNKGQFLWRHPVFESLRVRSVQGSVPIRLWHPESVQMLSSSQAADLPVLNGTTYPGASPVEGQILLTYRYPFQQTAAALPLALVQARYTLRIWCAVRTPADHTSASRYTTLSVSVHEGQTLRARTRLLSAGEAQSLAELPLLGNAPLRIVVDDAGDGNLDDEVYIGGAIVDRINGRSSLLTSLPYLLEETSQEAVQVFYFPTSEMRWSAHSLSVQPRSAFRVQAPAHIVLEGYGAAMARLDNAARLVREAERLWKAGKVSDATGRLAIAQRLDEGNPQVYRLRAQMSKAAGRDDLELQAWKRLVEISRADLPLRRQAKERIAELYRSLDGNRPEWEFRLPPAPPPEADVSALAKSIWRLQLKPSSSTDDMQTGELRFTVPQEQSGWWLQGRIDTRGLVVSASLERKREDRWQTVWRVAASEPQQFPLLDYQLSPGEYRLRIGHDSTRDGIEGAFHIALSLLLSREKPAHPQQKWTYRLHTDGSAEVEVIASGAIALPVPLTADGLQVEGARYSLLPPVYEYLSRLDLRHAQVLLLQPTDEQATVRFRWLDAAYNVPMTRYAPDRKEHFYFRSLAALGKARGEMDVVVHLPEGTGEIATLVPEPQSREGSILRFRLPEDRVAVVNAKHSQINTRWLTATYRRMTLHIPDTPFYRRWLPEYLALLMRIYDRERQIVGGYEPEDALFVSLTAPAQLSGYGGATWGGPRSETWIASTGRVGPYNLRYEAGGNGVEAHELKWVFLHGVGEGLPSWLQTGAVIYIEEQGKLAGNTAFPDVWYQRALRPGAQAFRKRFPTIPTPLQWSESEFRQQPAAQRMLGEAMAHEILRTIAQHYGNRVWAELFRRNREGKMGIKDLPDREKDKRIIGTLVEITRDASVKRLFEKWGFR